MIIPAVIGAKVNFEGRTYSLALVATHWKTEGVAIFEALSIDGKHTVALESTAEWTIRSYDDGPATLSISDLTIPRDLTSNEGELLDRLLDELVRSGGAAWGFLAHTTYAEAAA